MNWRPIHQLAVVAAMILAWPAEGRAGTIFLFTDNGAGTVSMQTFGSTDVSQLVLQSGGFWAGVGVETNPPPQSDIMGDTTMGSLNASYGFSAGTDLSPWIGGMFTISNFGWASAGSTQFATWYDSDLSAGVFRTPGLSINTQDLVGSIWTPNNSWSKAGSFASLGLTPGVYTITDATTGEWISIQIGGQVVPEPATLLLLGTGLGVLAHRRRRRA